MTGFSTGPAPPSPSASAGPGAGSSLGPVFLQPGQPITLAEFGGVVEGRGLALTDEAWFSVRRCSALLQQMVEERRVVYGATTGFGPLAGTFLSGQAAEELQRNLVYHLASGVGPPLSPRHTRALLAARIVTLAKGHSGIGAEALQVLLRCLNEDVLPVIPSQGTVGASGDLTPMAHVALLLLGEGSCWDMPGTRQQASLIRQSPGWGSACWPASWQSAGVAIPAQEALRRLGLAPLPFRHKEALAIVNGTAAMTGIAACNALLAQAALLASCRNQLAMAEVLHGRQEAWHPALADLRPHAGQQRITHWLWRRSQTSAWLHPSPSSPAEMPVLPEAIGHGRADQGRLLQGQALPQDAYTLRCAPQALGAAADLIAFHNQTVAQELDSVTDNPSFLPELGLALHGGNFNGFPVGHASDVLQLAVLQMGAHAERRIARLCDPLLNQGLPAFLQPHQTGLHSGFMGAQVTATALLAEMRSNAIPASVQSLPTNNNNQDIVSMGTIAARKTAAQLEMLSQVLAIEALLVAQAMDLRQREAPLRPFSNSSQQWRGWVRQHAEFLATDRPLSGEIQLVAAALSGQWRDALAEGLV